MGVTTLIGVGIHTLLPTVVQAAFPVIATPPPTLFPNVKTHAVDIIRTTEIGISIPMTSAKRAFLVIVSPASIINVSGVMTVLLTLPMANPRALIPVKRVIVMRISITGSAQILYAVSTAAVVIGTPTRLLNALTQQQVLSDFVKRPTVTTYSTPASADALWAQSGRFTRHQIVDSQALLDFATRPGSLTNASDAMRVTIGSAIPNLVARLLEPRGIVIPVPTTP